MILTSGEILQTGLAGLHKKFGGRSLSASEVSQAEGESYK